MDRLSEDEKYNILLQSQSSSIIERVRGTVGSRWKEPRSYEHVWYHWAYTRMDTYLHTSVFTQPSTVKEFEPLYKLVEEMTAKRVKMTSKSFAAVVDAASLSRDLSVMQRTLVLSRKNGICRAFSRDVGTIAAPPRDKSTIKGKNREVLWGGRMSMYRKGINDIRFALVPVIYYINMYIDLEPVPEDQRSVELGAGISALVVVGGALGDETIGPLFDLDTTPATIVLLLAGLSGLFDSTQSK